MMGQNVTLSTDLVTVTVNPSRGANITRLASPGEDNWFFFDLDRWQSPRGKTAAYDDVWGGGFEELFPNDAPEIFEGRSLVDHGELWNKSWEIISCENYQVHLSCLCETVPARVEKRIELVPGRVALSIHYELSNLGTEPFGHMFKLHPAMRLEAGDRILLPGGSTTPVDLSFSSVAGSEGPFQWPFVLDKDGKWIDVSLVPPRESRLKEFLYVSQLPEGFCGLHRTRTGKRVVLRYPKNVFPYCWLFMTYGGWRDYYTVVLEPCTNIPKRLTVARKLGTCAVLAPGERKRFSIDIAIE